VITRFNVCDLNAIETRVGAWLAECHDLMEVFTPFFDTVTGKFCPNGKDPYLAFASKMYGIPYEKLWADYKGLNGEKAQIEAKKKRQTAKPGVLGAIYRLGGGKWERNLKTKHKDHTEFCDAEQFGKKLCSCPWTYDMVRGGLWGYAYNMGVELDQETSNMVVRMFRESYPEICGNGFKDNPRGIWVRLEDAVADVMHKDHPNTVRYIGPNNCVKIDRLNIDGRFPMMRMQLPSGRRLHYLDAVLKEKEMPWTRTDANGNQVPEFREVLWYSNQNQTTNQWEHTDTQGGKLFENLVQAIARDILAVKLLMFEEREMPVVGHVHDEGICLVPNDIFSPTVEDMVEIMSKPVGWAPGLLLGADGFEDSYYHK